MNGYNTGLGYICRTILPCVINMQRRIELYTRWLRATAVNTVHQLSVFLLHQGALPESDVPAEVVMELRELTQPAAANPDDDFRPIGVKPSWAKPAWDSSRYPWIWQNTITNEYMFKALRVRNVCIAMTIFFFLVIIPLYVSVFCTNTDGGATFRPSTVVAMGADMDGVIQQLRSRAMSYMKLQRDVCGVSAANYRVYRRYAILRQGDHLIEVFNPRYNATDKAKRYSRVEFPTMCRDQAYQFVAIRATHINLTFDSPILGGNYTVALEGKEAACAQHYVDVLDGLWMCRLTSATNELLIPELPVDLRIRHSDL